MNEAPDLTPPAPAPAHPAPTFVSRDNVNALQVSITLNVLHALQPYLLEDPRDDKSLPKELDGGVLAAATRTFDAACGRLDELLADKSRWSLENHDALYRSVIDKNNAVASAEAERGRAIQLSISPSARLTPEVTTYGELFVAFWGNPHLPGGMILGKGHTPAAALADFDTAFTREVANQVQFSPAAIEKLKGPVVVVPPESVTYKPKKKGMKK